MRLDPLHHTIIATDVAKSGSRNDALLVRMRADLRQILDETLRQQGLSIQQLDVADLGDGYRLLLPASISPRSALDPFLANLATALRQHREASSEAHRMRLRVVIHSGLLNPERDGAWTGNPLRECARLLDAPSGRNILDAAPNADLVVLVSQTIYDSVVRHGYTVDPALFRRIRIDVKETHEDAWVYVPGYGQPHDPGDSPPPASAAANPPARPPQQSSSVTINGNDVVINSPVVGGNYHGGPGSFGAR